MRRLRRVVSSIRPARRAGVALLLIAAPAAAGAQALPVHTASALTSGFQENAVRTFGRFVGRSGAMGPDRVGGRIDAFVLDAGVIPFSFTPFWTVRVRVPWVSKSFTSSGRGPDFEAWGFGDPVVDTKWVIYRTDRPGRTRRIGIQAGVKAPVGDTDDRFEDGTVAPRILQLGTGSWDVPVELVYTEAGRRWGLSADAGWRFNTADAGFEAGDVFSYDVALGYRFLPRVRETPRDRTLAAYLELNGMVAGEDRLQGLRNPDSGGHVLFLSPDLQWVPAPWILFEGSVQIPVLQRLDGTQLEHETRVQVGSRVRFSVFR